MIRTQWAWPQRPTFSSTERGAYKSLMPSAAKSKKRRPLNALFKKSFELIKFLWWRREKKEKNVLHVRTSHNRNSQSFNNFPPRQGEGLLYDGALDTLLRVRDLRERNFSGLIFIDFICHTQHGSITLIDIRYSVCKFTYIFLCRNYDFSFSQMRLRE